jgi:5-methylcytosine-specific restriction endonuclease McrA
VRPCRLGRFRSVHCDYLPAGRHTHWARQAIDRTSRVLTPRYSLLMQEHAWLTAVPDDELLERLDALLQASRRTEADLVAHIGEVDRRRLYARTAAPSMFAYCTEVLHLSAAEAYLRIAAARAAREHSQLLAMLADGRLHLSAIAKLAPHLTAENRDSVLRRAAHRSKREVEELVAELSPRPDVPCLVRRLPGRIERPVAIPTSATVPAESGVGATIGNPFEAGLELRPDGVVSVRAADEAREPGLSLAPSRVDRLEPSRASTRSVMEPLAPSRYKVQFTATAALRDKLERLQALLRAELPEADLAAVIDRAVTQTLQRLEARRYARTRAAATGKASGSATSHRQTPPAVRYIPAAVRRAVFERDGGRCHYWDETGRRCPERHRLEYHHVHPFAMGGDHTADNVRLMCRTHNLYLAEQDFGHRAIAAGRRRMQQVATPFGLCDTT